LIEAKILFNLVQSLASLRLPREGMHADANKGVVCVLYVTMYV
jgi:hypothetical protein